MRENEVAATCTEEGSYDSVTYCSVCGEELSRTNETLAALGHDWGDWEVTTEPTCTEDGEEARVCANDSSHVDTQSIAATGHDWGEWTVTKEATEDEEGVETRVCANDSSHVDTRAIPKKDPEASDISYRNVTGDVEWTKGSADPAEITFKRSEDDSQTFGHFTGITMDGEEVDGSGYDAESGSVVVSLKPAYLETLSLGDHKLLAYFDDGDAVSGKVTVFAKDTGSSSSSNGSSSSSSSGAGSTSGSSSASATSASTSSVGKGTARTGDDANVSLALALAAASALLAMLALMRRRSQGE